MLRPLLLSLVLSGLAAGSVGADPAAPDVSTWRWSVSIVLDAQRAEAARPVASAETFDQRYMRYSVLGLPEAPAQAPGR